MTFLIEQSLKPAELLKKIELIEKESATGIKRLEERITALEKNVLNWIGITWENEWESGSSAYIPSFSKDHVNIVRFRGLGKGPNGVRAFTMPPGYRYSGENELFPVVLAGVHLGAAVVYSSGAVFLYYEAGTELALNSLTYPAEN